MMKQINLFLCMLLLAVMMLPVASTAQNHTLTSTFTGMGDFYEMAEGSGIINGSLLTSEGNNWRFNTLRRGNPESTSVGGCFALLLAGKAYTFSPSFNLKGYMKKVTVRAGGNISQIYAYISGGGSGYVCEMGTVDVKSSEVQDYEIYVADSWGETSLADNVDASRGVCVKITPGSGNEATILESITMEYVDELLPEGTSGTIGDLTWKVEALDYKVDVREKGTSVKKTAYRLIISGNGEMPDFSRTGYDDVNFMNIYDNPWFQFQSITEAVIESGVKSIGAYGLAGLPNLLKVSLPSSVETIGENASDNSYMLSTVNFPEGLKSIKDYAFAWLNNLKEVSLPASLMDLCDDGFRGAFRGNNISKLTVAEGNPKYDSRDNCNAVILTEANEVLIGTPATVIPASVKVIGNHSFNNNSNLNNFVIPDQVTTIGRFAFTTCLNMTEITVGKGVTSIAKGGIGWNSDKIDNVYFYANPNNLTWEFYDDTNMFKKDKATKFHVPGNYVALWQKKFPDLNATLVGDLPDGDLTIEPIVVTPADEAKAGEAVTTESGVTISLDVDDKVDTTDGSITLTKTMTPEEVEDLLKKAKPDEPNFYETFKGIYSMLSVGKGYVDIECEMLGDVELTVMLGSGKPVTYSKNTKGVIRVTYDLSDNEWMLIFPSVPSTARSKAGRASAESGLKIYSVKIVPEQAIKKGDANGDLSVNAADIVEVVNQIMGSPTDMFLPKGGDANEDGSVNAADIVAIVNLIMGN